MTEPTDPTTAADVDPQTAADAAERVQAFLDARAPFAVSDVIATVIPNAGRRSERFPLTASDLTTLLADRVRLEAELEQVRDDLAQAQDALLAEHEGAAAELERLRADSRDAYIASLFSEPVECECGCQPGQPCDCSLADCECIGDCPVCDADGMTYTLGKDPAR